MTVGASCLKTRRDVLSAVPLYPFLVERFLNLATTVLPLEFVVFYWLYYRDFPPPMQAFHLSQISDHALAHLDQNRDLLEIPVDELSQGPDP